jgi:riboflavin kinase/FMN adenylyltransferase
MQLIRDIHLMKSLNGSVVCMGNFDGLHRGHQQLLTLLKQASKKENVPSVVILFEPHPLEYFQPDNSPTRLMRLQDKLAMLDTYDIDIVICLRFTALLAARTATQFIEDDLVGKLHMRAIIAGRDCRFGYKRQGDIALLEVLAKRYHYHVIVAEDHCQHDQRISSTTIRQALAAGECAQAAALLGRPYSMTGRVMYGAQLGRQLGFPTANIACHRRKVPLSGIFAVMVHLPHLDQVYQGVAHIAKRHIMGDEVPLLEVYLFDFNASLYGKRITVDFLHKIRDTIAIDNLDELKKVIAEDVRVAQDFFANQNK